MVPAKGRSSGRGGYYVSLQREYTYFRIQDKLVGSVECKRSISQVKPTQGEFNSNY